MVVSDQGDTGQGPALNEDDPVGGLEPGSVMVDNPDTDGLLGCLATEVDQECWNDVLEQEIQKEKLRLNSNANLRSGQKLVNNHFLRRSVTEITYMLTL